MSLSLRTFFRRRRAQKVLQEWEHSGRPAPPPPPFKQQVIRDYARRFGTAVFIETGTFKGDMMEAMRDEFQRLYSIELGVDLWRQASQRFARFKHISIRQGDSSVVLKEILGEVAEPCLFWLDGHYSEGITAKGALNTPIVRELQTIFDHPVREHVILIDDARCFVGRDDYPAVAELQSMVATARPNLAMEVRDDIIRYHR